MKLQSFGNHLAHCNDEQLDAVVSMFKILILR